MINTDNVDVLADILTQNKLTISVAESCTGGTLASTLTSLSGASVYFDRGFVTYSNKAKQDLLGVNKDTITKYGAVSEHVALEMVKGVIKNSTSDFAVAITGIAGPSGGTTTKPVGMVCFGLSTYGNNLTSTQLFKGDRLSIISQSVEYSIEQLLKQS
jgi:nicotinamide-nucleotide amidase|tara:strand:+ start:243 stop:716 length:474 start_codon:yes stop_codon:yes gene_type:complete